MALSAKKQLAAAMIGAGFKYSTIVYRLGISRQILWRWRTRDEEFRAAVEKYLDSNLSEIRSKISGRTYFNDKPKFISVAEAEAQEQARREEKKAAKEKKIAREDAFIQRILSGNPLFTNPEILARKRKKFGNKLFF